jgi:hypothetical protein
MAFPTSATTGKGGKVLMNLSDGVLLTNSAMTKQASYTYKGTTYANRMYLLGTGKTLINMRPGVEPEVNIDFIADGLLISGTSSNDEIATSAGTIVVAGVETSVVADASVAVTRPASGEGAWVAVSVNKSTGVITATKGTDTTGSAGIAGLLDTWGSSAGQRPLIPVADLLVGLLKLSNGAAAVTGSDIFYFDRELQVPYQLASNIGGALINTALVACHVGTLTRVVNFTGYYLDTVLSEIGSAKSWSLNPNANTVSESTLGNEYSATELSGWSFSFEQLATSAEVINNLLNRQGYGAVRLQYPNGGYFQSACTFTATFNNAAGSFNNISVSGSMTDQPVFV